MWNEIKFAFSLLANKRATCSWSCMSCHWGYAFVFRQNHCNSRVGASRPAATGDIRGKCPPNFVVSRNISFEHQTKSKKFASLTIYFLPRTSKAWLRAWVLLQCWRFDFFAASFEMQSCACCIIFHAWFRCSIQAIRQWSSHLSSTSAARRFGTCTAGNCALLQCWSSCFCVLAAWYYAKTDIHMSLQRCDSNVEHFSAFGPSAGFHVFVESVCCKRQFKGSDWLRCLSAEVRLCWTDSRSCEFVCSDENFSPSYLRWGWWEGFCTATHSGPLKGVQSIFNSGP